MKLCLIMNKGEEALSFDIEGEAISIGRSKENDIHIQDKYISRKHLVLWKKGNRVFLKNLANRNGTKVAGHRVPSGATVEVKQGEAVKIGMSVFCFGQGNTGDMFAFLNSLYFSKESAGGETTTLFESTLS